MYRCLAIFIFFGSGAGSIYLFFQVTSLPILEGINEETLMTAYSLAWVMIFPIWIVLYFAAMVLIENILRILPKYPHIF